MNKLHCLTCTTGYVAVNTGVGVTSCHTACKREGNEFLRGCESCVDGKPDTCAKCYSTGGFTLENGKCCPNQEKDC